jgi:Cys-tRNA(Pro)/Cys-tRNA(Cys) deacylase
MNEYDRKLVDYIQEHGIQAEHLRFEQSCHSVQEAAAAANADPAEFVKNICLVGPQGELIVAIVKGEDRVSTSRVARAVGVAKARMATADEILAKSGFPCGGTPSFGFKADFLIDPRAMELETLYTGGGSDRSLVRIAPQELQRANHGTVTRVRK